LFKSGSGFVLLNTCRNTLLGLGKALGTHLSVKVLRPGDSEVSFSVFESSCYLLLPV